MHRKTQGWDGDNISPQTEPVIAREDGAEKGCTECDICCLECRSEPGLVHTSHTQAEGVTSLAPVSPDRT